jgi:hypothetical protein
VASAENGTLGGRPRKEVKDAMKNILIAVLILTGAAAAQSFDKPSNVPKAYHTPACVKGLAFRKSELTHLPRLMAMAKRDAASDDPTIAVIGKHEVESVNRLYALVAAFLSGCQSSNPDAAEMYFRDSVGYYSHEQDELKSMVQSLVAYRATHAVRNCGHQHYVQAIDDWVCADGTLVNPRH